MRSWPGALGAACVDLAASVTCKALGTSTTWRLGSSGLSDLGLAEWLPLGGSFLLPVAGDL